MEQRSCCQTDACSVSDRASCPCQVPQHHASTQISRPSSAPSSAPALSTQVPEALLIPSARPAPVLPFQVKAASSAILNHIQGAAMSSEAEIGEAAPVYDTAQSHTSAMVAAQPPRPAVSGMAAVQRTGPSAGVSSEPAAVRHARVQATMPSAADEAVPALHPALGDVHYQRLLQTDQSAAGAGIQVGTVFASCLQVLVLRY